MLEYQIIILTVWAGIAEIQNRFLGSIHIDRPLVSGLVVGLVTGHVGSAVAAGATMELIFLGAQRIGGSVPPNVLIGGMVGAVAAVTTGQSVKSAVAIGVPAALLGAAIEVFCKSVSSTFVHAAERYAEQDPPSLRGIATMVHIGNFLYFLEGAIPVFVFVQFGGAAPKQLFNALPQSFLGGLKVMGVVLPAIGFAIVLSMLLNKMLAGFAVIGFVLAAYLQVPAFGIALVGLAFAVLYFYLWSREPAASTRRQEQPTPSLVGASSQGSGVDSSLQPPAQGEGGSSDTGMNTDAGEAGWIEGRMISRRDLRRLFWRNFGVQSAFSFERMQTHGFVWVLMPLLSKLYPAPGDLRSALRRHLTFFNTDPYLGANVCVGVTAALEERRAQGSADIDDSAINGVKMGLMGPFAGIGDSLINGTMRIVITGVAVGLASSGSVLGPIFFLVAFNIGNFLIRWNGLHRAYSYGTRVVSLLRGNELRRWTEAGAILGLTVIAGLIPSYVPVKTGVTYSVGQHVEKLQSALDSFLPALIPLVIVLGSLWLVRRRVNYLYIMLMLAAVGLGLGSVNILST